ncbi:MAG TPA: DUF2190 family protein [Gemmataceae bacterium]|nr:DUF2190 family protein [Gemmataceae bacterium]
MSVSASFIRGKPIMQPYTESVAVNAGDVVVLGNMPCVAHEDIPAYTGGQTLDALAVRGGIYQMTADQNYYPVGTYVYWDPTAKKVTAASGGQCVPFGWIVGLANDTLSDTATSTTVSVAHDPSDDTGMLYQFGAGANDNLTNLAAETAFATTAVIPANQLVQGDMLHIKATGVVTAQNSTNTNNIKLKILTAANTFTQIFATGAQNVAANGAFIIEADLIFPTVGNSGTFYAVGDIAFASALNRQASYLANTNINTGTAVTIEVTDTQSAQSTGNVVQLLELLVEKRRK